MCAKLVQKPSLKRETYYVIRSLFMWVGSLYASSATSRLHERMISNAMRRSTKELEEAQVTHSCGICEKSFHHSDKLVEHYMFCLANRDDEMKAKQKREEGDGPAAKRAKIDKVGDGTRVDGKNDNPCSSTTTAFSTALKRVELKPRKDQKYDMSHSLRGKTKPTLRHLSSNLQEKRA